jgi:hypothetical protein
LFDVFGLSNGLHGPCTKTRHEIFCTCISQNKEENYVVNETDDKNNHDCIAVAAAAADYDNVHKFQINSL